MTIEQDMINIANEAHIATIATIQRIINVIDEGLGRPEGVDDRDFLVKIRGELLIIGMEMKDEDPPELKIKRMKIAVGLAESFIEYCSP